MNMMMSLPWSLKIVYGFISDSFPIFEMKRKPYLLIGASLNAVSLLAYCFCAMHSYLFLAMCILIGKIGLVFMVILLLSIDHKTNGHFVL